MEVAKHCVKCDRPDTADNLVGCDSCECWMNFGCAGVSDSIADVERSWKCEQCRDDNSVIQSRRSTGRTTSSKRSSKIELNLRLMEEQKAMRIRRILEEEAAQAATRTKLAEEEENFLKKKYDLLLVGVEDSEEGASGRSRLSSRASREKVRTWLSDQEVGVAMPSSRFVSAVVTSAAVQQSSIPAPSTSTSIVSKVPAVVAVGPASTSTPNSAADSRSGERTVSADACLASIPVSPGGDSQKTAGKFIVID